MRASRMRMKPWAACGWLVLVLWATPALSQGLELGVGQKRPWAQGVSQEAQASASAHFQEGNAQLENSLFVNAIESYERALALWSHPAIHYNLALALVNLKEPLRLRRHLREALRYGGQPLDSMKVARMHDLLKLVERQLVRVKVSCDVPGASVRMNGQELFMAPGQYEDWVMPGEYAFSIVREGYPLNERERIGAAGDELVLDYKVYTQEEMTRYQRPWPAWKPWALVGLGAALSGGGLLLNNKASDRYRNFDTAVLACSAANDNRGCLPTQEMLSQRARGATFQNAALGSLSVGGAAAALGLTLAYFNRLQADVVSPDEHEQSLILTPTVGSDQGGFTATFHF